MSSFPITLNQEVTGLLKCGICWEYYNLPTVLPCGHTFCLTCIQEIGKHKVNNVPTTKCGVDISINCPNCRLKVSIADIQRMKNGVHVNYVLSSVVEAVLHLKSAQKVDAATNTDSDACFRYRIDEIQKNLDAVFKAVDKRKSVVNDARIQIDELRTKAIRRKMVEETLKRQNEAKSNTPLSNPPMSNTQDAISQGTDPPSPLGINPMTIFYRPSCANDTTNTISNQQTTWASRLFLPERIQNADHISRNVHSTDLSDVDPAILSVRTTTTDMAMNNHFFPLAML